MTRNSPGPLAETSLRPSCCCSAAKLGDVWPLSSAGYSKWKFNGPLMPVLLMTGWSNLRNRIENMSRVTALHSMTMSVSFRVRSQGHGFGSDECSGALGGLDQSSGMHAPGTNGWSL